MANYKCIWMFKGQGCSYDGNEAWCDHTVQRCRKLKNFKRFGWTGREPTHKFENNVWHVYLLECRDLTLYCGITNNIHRRLAQHNEGTASKYTRGRRPVILVSSRAVSNKSEALKLEAKIKKLSTHKKCEALMTMKVRKTL